MTASQCALHIFERSTLRNVEPDQLSLVDLPSFGHCARSVFVRMKDQVLFSA